MKSHDTEWRWERLEKLLAPLHQQAARTARALCKSRTDGDDLYQEAVLRAFRKLHTLRDETRFRAWFFAVLLSIHRSRCRASFWKRFLSLDRDLPRDLEVPGPDGRRFYEQYEAASRVAHALGRLPTVQREAVVLHEIEGFTVEEIAAMQCVSVSAVKSRLARGRSRLRDHYTRLGWAPEGESSATNLGAEGAIVYD